MFKLVVREGMDYQSTKIPNMVTWVIRAADQAVQELNLTHDPKLLYTLYLITFKRGRETRIWQLSSPSLGIKVEVAYDYQRYEHSKREPWRMQVLFQRKPNPTSFEVPKEIGRAHV